MPQSDGGVARATQEDPLHVHYAIGHDSPFPVTWRPATEMPDFAVRARLRVTSATPMADGAVRVGFEVERLPAPGREAPLDAPGAAP